MATRRNGQKTFSELFPQLFLFPLILVAVGVLVYLFFVASAQDSRTVDELISDIESGGSHARKQDLYALAGKVRELEGPGGQPVYFDEGVTRKLLGLLERSQDDENLRAALILAVGRAGKPELTVPVMAEAALRPQASDEARMYAVQSLGLSRSPQAIESLQQVLGRFPQPESWELRWNTLAALANIGGEAAVSELRKALGDPRREIHWSAACWLGNLFGDAAGIGTLRQLSDWKFLDQERGDQNRELQLAQKEQYMVMALEALWRLEPGPSRSLLEEKSRDNRSFRVKDIALRLLEGAESPKATATTAGGQRT